MKRNHAFILALLITILIASNLFLLHSQSSKKTVLVTKVIDGDTFQFGEDKARLVNINTPEKSEKGYEEAKEFLSKIENKEVQIEDLGRDKYGRMLVRVYSPEYLNLEIVRKGLATKFLVQESELKNFDQAEETAIENGLGIWEKSQYYGCFQISIKPVEEEVTLENICNSLNIMDFIIRDESRKRYKFPSISSSKITLHSSEGVDDDTDLFWNVAGGIWNNDRDTAYLLDEKSNIVAFSSYGY